MWEHCELRVQAHSWLLYILKQYCRKTARTGFMNYYYNTEQIESITVCHAEWRTQVTRWVDIALATLPDCVASDCWTPEFYGGSSIRKCFVRTITNLRLFYSALTFNILSIISDRLLLRTLWPLCHLKVTSLHTR